MLTAEAFVSEVVGRLLISARRMIDASVAKGARAATLRIPSSSGEVNGTMSGIDLCLPWTSRCGGVEGISGINSGECAVFESLRMQPPSVACMCELASWSEPREDMSFTPVARVGEGDPESVYGPLSLSAMDWTPVAGLARGPLDFGSQVLYASGPDEIRRVEHVELIDGLVACALRGIEFEED